MSQQAIPLLAISLLLTGTVGANKFVTPAGIQTGAGLFALGVARTDGVSGDLVTVDTIGTAVVLSGAAVTKGQTVKADASGRAIDWVTSGARLGIALQAATAADQPIEILLLPNAV